VENLIKFISSLLDLNDGAFLGALSAARGQHFPLLHGLETIDQNVALWFQFSEVSQLLGGLFDWEFFFCCVRKPIKIK
jgi:hypothetical protein